MPALLQLNWSLGQTDGDDVIVWPLFQYLSSLFILLLNRSEMEKKVEAQKRGGGGDKHRAAIFPVFQEHKQVIVMDVRKTLVSIFPDVAL